jgi:hypothetical protein
MELATAGLSGPASCATPLRSRSSLPLLRFLRRDPQNRGHLGRPEQVETNLRVQRHGVATATHEISKALVRARDTLLMT